MEHIKNEIAREAQEIFRRGDELQIKLRQRIVTYIVAAFGLIVGLAWNDAIKSAIEYWFPLDKNSLSAKFIYAVLITVILVLVVTYFTRATGKENE